MKKILWLLVVGIQASLAIRAQEPRLWLETDRQYLVDNLTRTRDLIVRETEGLGSAQWSFKESPERWSINQVVEHLAIWELLFDREITMSLSAGPQPELNKTAKPDSTYFNFIMETKPHISIEYTKPFTYTLPMGLDEGKNNVIKLLKMRNESINYLKTAKEDLRSYYLRPGRGNIHQTYINVFGHTDRHLRQIRKVKEHKDYPKK